MSKYDRYFSKNKELWDARTILHVDSKFYDVPTFLAGQSSLNEIEKRGLGPISDKKILHLQCHFGMDSMSMSRMGARVTGVDLSETSMQKARELNDRLGLTCKFVQCNIYDTEKYVLEDFDIVYTSYGVLCWLPDLTKWAQIIANKLKPGGRLYMVEFHPLLYMYDWDKLIPAYDYFHEEEPLEEEYSSTYTEGTMAKAMKEYSWSHSTSGILQALIDAGLQITKFEEYDYSPYNCFPNMKEVEQGKYMLNFNVRFPHLLELDCRKPT